MAAVQDSSDGSFLWEVIPAASSRWSCSLSSEIHTYFFTSRNLESLDLFVVDVPCQGKRLV